MCAFVAVNCNTHVVQVFNSSVCTLYIHLCFFFCRSVMQCAFDADTQHCFVYLKPGSVLCPRVSCSMHVSLMDGQCCFVHHTVDTKFPFKLEYIAKVQIVDSGAVPHSRAMCAVAPGFLVQSLRIPDMFWLLNTLVANMHTVPRAYNSLVSR